ncbi:MAG TPA: pitrilysin family protein [Rubricoccaceae bacterium]
MPHRMLRRTALFVLLAGALAPAAGAQTLLARFDTLVTRFELPNGMTFLVVPRRDAPVVSFFTYADVGSVDEPIGQSGVAHMFEHMAFKGTTSLGTTDLPAELAAMQAEDAAFARLRQARDAAPSGTEPDVTALDAAFAAARDSAAQYVDDAAFDRLLDASGAVGVNAFTSADQTGYFYSLPANKAELWFATEADRFVRPVLREFYQERDVVIEERRLRTDSRPTGRLFEDFLTTAFKAHPYGRPTIGYISDLQALSRAEAQAFFDAHYSVSNLTVAIVGDVDVAEMQRLATLYFGSVPRGPTPARIPTVEPVQLGERRVTLLDRAQPYLLMGYHRPAGTHPDAAVYTVLADVLDAGRTSRFYRGLVETQRAAGTGVYEAFPGEKYPGLFVVIAVPSPGVDPDSLEADVTAQLDRVATDGVTDEELTRAKTRARAGLVAALTDNDGLASALAEAEALGGDWRSLFRDIDALDAVTADDVRRVAAATFTRANRTVATLRTGG